MNSGIALPLDKDFGGQQLPFDDTHNEFWYCTGAYDIARTTPGIVRDQYNIAVKAHHEQMATKVGSIRAYLDELRMVKQLGTALNTQRDISQLYGLMNNVGPNGKLQFSQGYISNGLEFDDPHWSGAPDESGVNDFRAFPHAIASGGSFDGPFSNQTAFHPLQHSFVPHRKNSDGPKRD